MRTLLIAMVGLGMGAVGTSSADVTCVEDSPYTICVINNGLAPPNPENVINDATYANDGVVSVHNTDCPPGWPSGSYWDFCSSPGDPTEVEVVEGAVAEGLYVWDSSIARMNGGTVTFLYATGSSSLTITAGTVQTSVSAEYSSTLTMTGGTVQDVLFGSNSASITMGGGAVGSALQAWDSSTIRMSGGTVGGNILADDTSTIIFVGTDFMVDGTPVPYGDLTAEAGTLTGTLASGDPINNAFEGGGSSGSTITLLPPSAIPAFSPWSQIALMAGLLGAGLSVWRGLRGRARP